MKERPLNAKAHEVRAILAGNQTQLRRIAKDLRHPNWGNLYAPSVYAREPQHVLDRMSPYGSCGNRLWVRETWRPRGCAGPLDYVGLWDVELTYAADGAKRIIRDDDFSEAAAEWLMPKAAARGNVSPLFMPRWASRITLEVVGVRVERLQEISEADAAAEGCYPQTWEGENPMVQYHGWMAPTPAPSGYMYRNAYRRLWESINGPGSWDANPWVWVVEFRRLTQTEAGR